MTDQEWVAECKYISNQTEQVKAGFPGKEFNYDTECFRRYARMQRDTATREGFSDSAAYIDQCLDDIEGLS